MVLAIAASEAEMPEPCFKSFLLCELRAPRSASFR
jgi:hypothetical protein